jgi:peptide/nickel transport system substrate-binding protein
VRRSTGVVFAVVASLLVVACGSSTTSPSPASSQGASSAPAASQPAGSEPAPSSASGGGGGDLIFGGNQEPAGLDPYSAITVDALQVTGQIYETLLNIPQGQLTPVAGIATSWENNADFTSFTFKLRDGMKFQNGDPLDAAAVAAHFDRLKNDSATPSTVMAALKLVYTGATVVDPLTVTLNFSKPQTAMYLTLADPGSAITDAKYVQSVGADAPRMPMGSGPFKFVKWTQGVEIDLAKNPDWTWGNPDVMGTAGPAKLDTLTFKYLNDPQTRTAAVEAGDVQFIDLVPFQNLGSLRTNDKLTTLGIPLPGLPQGNWMNTQIAPFDDLAVRQAAEYAVDRSAIISTVYFDLVKPAYGPLTPDFPDYDPAVETMYPFNPDKAKSLLDGAGWVPDATTGLRMKDGKSLTVRILENRGWNDWVTVLQDQLRNVGFDAQVVTEEGGGYYAAAGSQKYEMPAMGSIDTNPVQVMSYSTAANLAGGVNGFGQDPKIEKMYTDALGEIDPAKRTALIKEWQDYVMQQAYWVSIFEFQFFSAFDKNVQGLKVDGTGFYKYFANVTMN